MVGNTISMAAALQVTRSGSQDLEDIHRCACETGWTYSQGEWGRILDLASDVCVCWVQPDGEHRRIAGVGLVTSVVQATGKTLDLVGMMLTHPEYRRRGIGGQIFGALTSRSVEKGHDMALVATDAGARLYEKKHFVPVSIEPKRRKYVHNSASKLRALIQAQMDTSDEFSHFAAVNVAPADLESVVALDKQALGMDRTAILQALTSGTSDGSSTAKMVICRDDEGKSIGFAAMSYQSQSGSMALGPVVANSAQDAMAMVSKLLPTTTSFEGSDKCNSEFKLSMFLSGGKIAESFEKCLISLGFELQVTSTAMEKRVAPSSGSAQSPSYLVVASPAWG